MKEIDLTEKLKKLEAEVEEEVRQKNEEAQKIWDEMTGKAYNNSEHSRIIINNGNDEQSATKDRSSGGSSTPQDSVVPQDSAILHASATPQDSAAPQTSATLHASAMPQTSSRVTLDDLNAPVITKDDFSDGARWALTLAGGGGKGSYQIGVWKALREMKLMKDIIAVSGSSVGALNAALISLGDYDNAESIWNNILPKQFLDINPVTTEGPIGALIDRSITNGLCSRDGLINIIDTRLDLNSLIQSPLPAYVCVAWYTSDCIECLDEKPVAEYISLSEVDKDDAKKLLLVSSAMPYIYPPETIHGKVYRDGGLADNVPVMPMTTVGADKLIVVKLEPDDKVDTSLYSRFKEVVEIVPSREIGDLLDGTLDFNARNVHFRLLLGYYDTLRTFSLRMYQLNGIPLNRSEALRREEEDFQKILSLLRRDRAVKSAEDNMGKLNSLLDKIGIL